jgi:hypothetical protein
VATGACSTTATISRTRGRPIDARIVGADRDSVYVRGYRGALPIPHSEISDIDHPGDTAMAFGSVIAGYGVFNIAVGAPRCEDEGAAFCTGVFTPAVLGLGMLLWGAVVHSESVEALERRPPRGARPTPSQQVSANGMPRLRRPGAGVLPSPTSELEITTPKTEH